MAVRNPLARRRAIQRALTAHGVLSVEELCRLVQASPATVRRDLAELEREQVVERSFGGAALKVERPAEQAFAVREEQETAGKHQIAAAVLTSIPLGATTALATTTPAGPFELTLEYQLVSWDPNPTPEGTFAAQEPFCSSGTFVGTPLSVGDQKYRFTCDDGSGSFYALKNLRITFLEDGTTSTGPIQLMGGTGAYTRLRGHGVDNGTAVTGDVLAELRRIPAVQSAELVRL